MCISNWYIHTCRWEYCEVIFFTSMMFCLKNRAEKSKMAAKRRRDNESVELDRLIDLLPFSSDTLKKMDKNSLMDLLLDYIRMKHCVQKGQLIYIALKNTNAKKVGKVCLNDILTQHVSYKSFDWTVSKICYSIMTIFLPQFLCQNAVDSLTQLSRYQ